MKKYIIEEQRNIYRVLLYSDNPILINELYIKLKKENIFLKVKNLIKNDEEDYDNLKNNYGFIKVIVDLTGNSLRFNQIEHASKQPEDKFLYILNKSFKRFTAESFRNRNNVIFVDKITKISADKMSDFLISGLAGNDQKPIDLTKKENIVFYKKYKYPIFLLILLFAIFVPFILMVYLLLNNYIFDNVILQKISLKRSENVCRFDKVEKKYIKGIISNYTKIPYLSSIYQKPLVYASGSYEESIYACDLISYLDNINSTVKTTVLYGVVKEGNSINTLMEKIPNVSRRFYLYPNFNKTLYSYREELFLFSRLYDLINKNLYSFQKKYFLLLLQDSNTLTPTGGVVEEIIIFSTENGRLVMVDKIEPSKLNQQFKGRVGSEIFPENPFIKYDYDKALNFQDKFKILKTIFSESSNVNICGIVSVEKQDLSEFMNVTGLLGDKNISLFKSLENYKKILPFLKSRNINFIVEEGTGLIGSKEVLSNEAQKPEKCNLNIKIIQEKENNPAGTATKVKVFGKKKNNLLHLTLNVLESSSGINDMFLLGVPEGGLIDAIDKKIVNRYEFGKEEYLSLNINKEKNGGDVEIINDIGACTNGFSIVFEKQPGNDAIQLNYDYTTDSEYNLYLDGDLTDRGNKFYNTQSFSLLHDTIFYFVK
jgi:hypothetical protein